jgi:hypothetical protein
MKKYKFLFLLFSVTLNLFSKDISFVDKEAKFNVNYPDAWVKAVNQDGVNLSVTSKDGNANVQILSYPVDEGVKSQDILSAVEQRMNFSENLLPEKKRAISASQLKSMNGNDGAEGVYRTEADNNSFLQGIYVIIKEKQAYIIIQTLVEAERKTYGKIVGGILKSFKILN